jgi:hypothetical protein
MADALSLLRQFTIENKEYTIENDRFVFNDLAYPKDIKTNYLVYGCGFFHLKYLKYEFFIYLVLEKILHQKIIIHLKVLFFY